MDNTHWSQTQTYVEREGAREGGESEQGSVVLSKGKAREGGKEGGRVRFCVLLFYSKGRARERGREGGRQACPA